jgi:hypothetical protein
METALALSGAVSVAKLWPKTADPSARAVSKVARLEKSQIMVLISGVRMASI